MFYHAVHAEPEDFDLAIYGTSAYEYPDLLKVISLPYRGKFSRGPIFADMRSSPFLWVKFC